MSICYCVVVDLGVFSGWVMFVSYQFGLCVLMLCEIYCFINSLQKVDGFDCWDVDSLEGEICCGLEKVCEQGILIDSIGIDIWGVDYVLLDKQGQCVGLLIFYCDDCIQGLLCYVEVQLGWVEIYCCSGIQFLLFNMFYQLCVLVEQQLELVSQVVYVLLIFDYFSFCLIGNLNWEYINVIIIQLVNINSDSWDEMLLNWIGVLLVWFGKLIYFGNVIGYWICLQGN